MAEPEERKKTVGEILRAERAKKKLTLDEVSFKTKISKRLIKCMEENKFSELPSPVALKGFLKIYSEFLGIPFEPLAAELKELSILDRKPALKISRPIEAKPGMMGNRPSDLKYVAYAVSGLAVLLVALILIAVATSCSHREPPKTKIAPAVVPTTEAAPAKSAPARAPLKKPVPRTVYPTGEL